MQKATQHSDPKSTHSRTQQPFFGAEQATPFFQPKLEVSAPGDKYEQEADAMADQVVEHQAGDGPVLQRMSVSKVDSLQRMSTDTEPAEEELQRKPEEEEETPSLIQTKRMSIGGGASEAPSFLQRLKDSKSGGRPIHPMVEKKMGAAFGADFSMVKIHTGDVASKLSAAIQAKAFTHGKDIYFNEGQYTPERQEGSHLLAHELTHTLHQQAAKPVQVKSDPATSEENKEEPSSNKETVETDLKKAPTLDDIGAVPTETAEDEIPKSPQHPEDDPAFLAEKAGVEQKAKRLKKHPEPETKKAETDTASLRPVVDQKAEGNRRTHVQQMNEVAGESERKPITAASFKATLQKHIDELENELPKNEDDAKRFKREKPISQMKQKVGQTVKAEGEAVAGPMAQEAQQEQPPQADVPTTEPTKLAAEKKAKTPAPVNAAAAIPKPKTDAEISMQKESEALDEQMKEGGITEKQLERSNEPEFLKALDDKRNAQQQAEAAPNQYRDKEETILGEAQGNVAKKSRRGIKGMLSAKTGSINKVLSTQTTTANSDITKQNEVSRTLEGIYTETKSQVVNKLEALSSFVDEYFELGAGLAQTIFEKRVEEGLEDIYGWFTFDDYLFGEDTEAIEKVFNDEKRRFIASMNDIFDVLAKAISLHLNQAIKIIQNGRKRSEEYYESLDKKQQKLAADAMKTYQDQYDELEDTVYDKQDELVSNLVDAYQQNVGSLRDTFDSIKEDVSSGWIKGAIEGIKGVIETIKQLMEMIDNLLQAISSVIGIIMEDPIKFVGDLFDGIKIGFDNFKANIKQHLIAGLLTWLTGAMAPMQLQLPEDIFSLSGIFSLLTQVLQLTWTNFRTRAVKRFGEPVVKALEGGVEIFKVVKKEGLSGLWGMVKDKFTDLKATVMDTIQDLIRTKVIEAGIKWLLSLLIPGAGFIKAIMAIKELIAFFVKSAMMLIPALTDAILGLANGSKEQVAQAIERGFAGIMALVINLFAKLIGLGGLAKRVKKIMERIRKRVVKAMDWVLGKGYALAKKTGILKLVKKGKAAFEKGKEKVVGAAKGVKDKVMGLFGWSKTKKSFRTGDGESHNIYVKKHSGKSQLFIASDPKPADNLVDELLQRYKDDDEKISVLNRIKSTHLPLANRYISAIERAEQRSKSIKDDQAWTDLQLQVKELYRQLLLVETLITTNLNSVIDKSDYNEIANIYEVEGRVGVHKKAPKKKYKFDADHQPSNKMLSVAAAIDGAPWLLQQIAASRSSWASTITLHVNRHRKGRTYGRKATAVAHSFVQQLNSRLSNVSDPSEQVAILESLLQQEAQADADWMINLVQSSSISDALWNDINQEDRAEELKEKISGQIVNGENILGNQRISLPHE